MQAQRCCSIHCFIKSTRASSSSNHHHTKTDRHTESERGRAGPLRVHHTTKAQQRRMHFRGSACAQVHFSRPFLPSHIQVSLACHLSNSPPARPFDSTEPKEALACSRQLAGDGAAAEAKTRLRRNVTPSYRWTRPPRITGATPPYAPEHIEHPGGNDGTVEPKTFRRNHCAIKKR